MAATIGTAHTIGHLSQRGCSGAAHVSEGKTKPCGRASAARTSVESPRHAQIQSRPTDLPAIPDPLPYPTGAQPALPAE